MAESLEQYIARIKKEHDERVRQHKGTLNFFLEQIRELAGRAVSAKKRDEKLDESAKAAVKAHEYGEKITPARARTFVANNAVVETNTTITRQYYGRMLFYMYDPKLKQKLPYWDRFPLIFVISVKNNSCLGINLHYLPPVERARLLYNLMTLANSKNLDDGTKLLMTYRLLVSSAKFRYFKPCIKRYLLNHIQSQVMVIDPKKWQEVVFLPLAGFQKQDEYEIWTDSINILKAQVFRQGGKIQ